MTEGVTIYLLLWLLYLSECFVWISKRSVAFVSGWNREWHLRVPSSFIASLKAGAVLLNPLWPGTRVVLASLAPISISPEGICAFNPQSFFDAGRPVQSPDYFCFDEIETCTSNHRSVVINTSRAIECANVAESRQIADLINQAVRIPSSQRQQLIRQFLARRFDQSEALDSFASMSNSLRSLELLCSVFFPLLFIIAPLMAFRYGLEKIVVPIAIGMIVFAVAIAVVVWIQYPPLSPSLSAERWSSVLKIVFCPPGAIRAVGELTANFPMTCDPLVVSTLLPHAERERFVLAYLRDLHFPIKDGLEGPAKDVVDWYRAELLKQTTAYVKTQSDLRLDSVMAPPVFEADCQSYCPRCGSQFTTEAGDCSGCDGVHLVRPQSALSEQAAKAPL